MKKLHDLFQNSVFRSYLQIGGSVLLGFAILSFCISSAVHNNETSTTAVVQTTNIAERHNEKVNELVQDDKLLKDPQYYEETDVPQNGFSMTVLDVGQGLCCLIECDGSRMLFDGGDRDTSSFVVSYITKTKGLSYLDYVVASHYDSDHIAGLIGILKNCKVGFVMGPPYEADTKTYQSFVSAANLKGGIYYPSAGETFNVGSAVCTVVSPQPTTKPYDKDDENDDENRLCLGLSIIYNNTNYLIMGDATCEEEEESIDAGYIGPVDVLIVNHHGSASSTSERFIQTVQPQIAVISVGANNEYGHPTDIVMSRLANTLVYRTDYNGTVEIRSDGINIDVYTEK